jgi:hypothetical protein
MNEAERLDRVTKAIIGAAMGVRRRVCRVVNDFPDSRRSPRPRR